MALITRTLTNTGDPVTTPSGAPKVGAAINFQLVDAVKRQPCSLFDAAEDGGEYVVGTLVTATTNEAGIFSVALWPNNRGEIATFYKVTLPGTTIKPFYIMVSEGVGDITLISAKAAMEAVQPQTLSLFESLLASIMELVGQVTAVATETVNGLMSYVDKVRLNDLWSRATVGTIEDLRTYVSPSGSVRVVRYYADGYDGGGVFTWATGAPGTYVDNGGTIIVPTGGDGSGAWIRNHGKTINVEWFGQKCDGTVESPAATIAAINYAISVAPATVRWPGGRVKYDAILGVFTGSNVTLNLNNTVLDFTTISTASTDTLLHFTGSYGTGVALTSDVAANQKTVAVNSAGFAAGNLVRIYSESVWDPDRTSTRCGELNFVETVPDGASLTLTMELQDGYATASTAKIEKLTPIYDVVVKNGTVIGPAGNDELKGIRFTLGIGCKLRDVRSFDIDYLHAQFTDCVDSHANSNYFKESNNAATAYGISFADSCQDCSAHGNKFIDVRHSLSTNNNVASSYGITRRILFEGNIVRDSAKATGGSGGDAIDTHAGAEDIFIHNNIIHSSSSHGVNVEARSASVIGNKIKHTAAAGIHIGNYSGRSGIVEVSDNKLQAIGDGSGTDPGIWISTKTATSGYHKLVMNGNIVDVATTEAFRIQGRSDNPITNAAITGNSGETSGTRAMYLSYVDDAAVVGNTIKSNGFVPIEVNNCNRVTVVGNPVTMAGTGVTGYIVRFTGTGSGSIVTGNTLAQEGAGYTTSYPVHLADTITGTHVGTNQVTGTTAGAVLGAGAGNTRIGGAALLDVGTAAGTVAAGDDARLQPIQTFGAASGRTWTPGSGVAMLHETGDAGDLTWSMVTRADESAQVALGDADAQFQGGLKYYNSSDILALRADGADQVHVSGTYLRPYADSTMSLGSSTKQWTTVYSDNINLTTGGWDTGHFILGTHHMWIDSTGKLRIKNGAPTGDTDGTVVGQQ